jgi:hypothetical protein
MIQAIRTNRTILTVMALLAHALVGAQSERLEALGARPTDAIEGLRAKSTLNTHFIYDVLPQSLPLMDDFSIDRTLKRWATASDPGVNLETTFYALEVAGTSTPDMVFADDTTFRYTIDLADPDNPLITRAALPIVQVVLRDVTVHPPTSAVVDAWPAYNIFDTLQSPPEDTVRFVAPPLVQDSLLVYRVDADERTYFMNDIATPLILWEDDDVYVNGTYPISPPTIGVATFDGLARTGYPYVFEQYSAYGIADHLTSVPIDLSYSPADSVYLSFFIQPRGLSGDAEVQPQDSLVLEFFAPLEEQWVRVWRTPYTTNTTFRQVLVPIREDRFLRDGFRMRFLNYATLSGSFDHWHLDYVRLAEARTYDDTVLVDMAYVEPESTLLQTYTSMPFHAFEQDPVSYMAASRTLPIRNLDVNDRFITWRMQAGIDGEAPVFDLPIYGNSTSGNASSVIQSLHPFNSPPNSVVYDPALSTDAAFWRVRFLARTQPDINPYNDTITFVQELSNYYAYDDGSAELGYRLDASGAQLAYRFDIVGGDSLRALRIYFNPQANPPPDPQPDQGSFLITVWKSLEPEIIQHQNFSFSTPQYKQEGLNRFVEYPLDSTIRVEGTFYVGWTQTNAASMNIGFDRNRNNQSRISYRVGADWQQTGFQGSLMMRPVFVAAVDPFIGITDPAMDADPITLVPNPTSTVFRIVGIGQERTVVHVLDGMGRLVLERTVSGSQDVDVSGLVDGAYVVRSVSPDGGSVHVSRLMIQR